MKALQLVLITSVCLLMAFAASAQVKIGDDELERGQDHWLEIKRSDTLFIVTDALQLGRTNDPHTVNPHNPSTDAIMLKLYGYGLGSFVPTNVFPYIQDTITLGGVTSNVFAGITNDGQLLEVPLKLVLEVQDTTTADLSFFNGQDTFGTVDLTPIIAARTFYLSDGTLDENRTVNGDGNTLTFNNLDSTEFDASFITIDGDQVAIQQDGQDIIGINALEQVKFRSTATDSILFLDTTGIISASYYGDIANADPSFSTIVGVLSDGTLVDVDVNDILGAQEDSVIYRHDGTLTGDRTLTGANMDLSFSGVDSFNVTGNGVVVNATDVDLDGTTYTEDFTNITSTAGATNTTTGVDVNVTATTGDATVESTGGNTVVEALTGIVDINTPDLTVSDTVQLEAYGDTLITGTLSTVLATDVNGNVIEVTAEEILATDTDSVIYRHDGTLTGDRTLTGANMDLSFSGVDSFNVTGNGVVVNATDVDLDGTTYTEDFTNITSTAGATNTTTGVDVNVTATTGDATVESTGANTVIEALTGIVDINAPDLIVSDTVQLEAYGDTLITGTLSTVLATDVNGNVIEVTAEQLLGSDVDSTIYTHDGTLTADRTMTGANMDLTFSGLDVFNITGDSVDIDATTVDMDGTNLTADYTNITTTAGATNTTTGVDVNVTATTGDATVESTGANTVIEALTGIVDVNTPDLIVSDTVQLEAYGDTLITGTLSTVLATDVNGNVIEVTAEQLLATDTDSTIYTHDGTLTEDRTMTGANMDLTFSGLDVFNITGDSVDIDATTVDMDGTNLTADYTNITTTAGATNTTTGVDVNVTATTGDATVESTGANTVIEALTGIVDVNTPDLIVSDTVQLEAYGDTLITGTLSTVLATDVNGNVIEVTAEQLLGSDADSTIYTHDGTLTEDRTMTGANMDLTFSGLDVFQVGGDSLDMNMDNVDMDGTNLTENYTDITTDASATHATSGATVTVTATTNNATIGATSGNTILNANSGIVDVNAPDVTISDTLQLESYGDTTITGTLSTLLAADVNGNVIEVTAQEILATDTDSVIYRHDGTLTGDRTMTGAGFDLTFDNLDVFNISGDSLDVDSDNVDLDGVNYTADYSDDVTVTALDNITSTAEDIVSTATDSNSVSGTNVTVTAVDNISSTAEDIVSTATDSNSVSGTNVVVTAADNISSTAEDIVSTATDTNSVNGAEVTVTAFSGNTAINASLGIVDINAPDVTISDTLQLEAYGDTLITGTLSTVLATDVDGNVIEVTAEQLLGSDVDSTIYTHDGTLTADRTMTGANMDLTFSLLDVFQVSGDSLDMDMDNVDMDGTNLTENYTDITTDASATHATSGATVTVTATTNNATIGATSGNTILNANSGIVDVNAPDVTISDTLQLESYGDTTITGTLSTLLATDVNGNVIEVTAQEILATDTDSVIYRHDGTLTGERYMTMDTYNLHFVEGTDTTIITNDGRMAIGRGSVTQGTGTANDIRLDVNGDILAIQVHSSSDERFKKDIAQVDNALDKVQAINGVTYNFRTDEYTNRNFPESKQLGFIAQNVEEVLPEVVRTDAEGYKSIDYAKLTALLNEAIKEQQKEIEKLTEQLGKANDQNEYLANEIASIKQMIKGISNLAVSDED